MRATSYSELRRNLASEIDRVTEDHEPVVITRGGGKPSAVLISLDDFGSYEETAYLLRSPKNAKRLLRSIAELERGGGKVRKLIKAE
jgi:antitoxin YefM